MKTRYFTLPSYLILISFLCFNFHSSDNSEIDWTTFDKIDGKIGKKMVFIELYTPWCDWCRRMENLTFSDPMIAKYMNKNFNNIKFDAENRRAVKFLGKNYKFDAQDGTRGRHTLAKALMADSQKQGYPTVVFLDENHNLIQAIPGYITARDFEAIVHYFGDGNYKSETWEQFAKKYDLKYGGSSNLDGTNDNMNTEDKN
jgi:thioredoxin-related protein